jgi:transposase
MSTTQPIQMSPSQILYLGLDVHKESITIAVLPASADQPTRTDKVPNEPKALRRYFAKLAAQGTIRACYEASGAGYVLERMMREWGYACEIVAPSLIPQRPGHQRKHDRYDARQLARLYRSGELTTIRIPTEAEERVRDLVRCRGTLQRNLLRTRHYVLKLLTRRGVRYTIGKTHWTRAHHAWLARLVPTGVLIAEDAVVFQEYFALMQFLRQRRDALDVQIEQLAVAPALAAAVSWLCCFRGIQTQAAMTLTTELVDWGRFETAGQLMAFVGLVPREDSSDATERRGSITKAGNSYCRHVLIQAAWAYRHPPRTGAPLARRQQGQPATVIAHAWKAQHRLHKLYQHLAYRKSPQVAVVAVARELVGFLWAVMRDAPPLAIGLPIPSTQSDAA